MQPEESPPSQARPYALSIALQLFQLGNLAFHISPGPYLSPLFQRQLWREPAQIMAQTQESHVLGLGLQHHVEIPQPLSLAQKSDESEGINEIGVLSWPGRAQHQPPPSCARVLVLYGTHGRGQRTEVDLRGDI